MIRDVLKPLAKSVLVPLGLTVTTSLTDAAIQKKIFWVRHNNLIFSNEELNAIKKLLNLLKTLVFLTVGVTELLKIK